jgi:hypothetical protein
VSGSAESVDFQLENKSIGIERLSRLESRMGRILRETFTVEYKPEPTVMPLAGIRLALSARG